MDKLSNAIAIKPGAKNAENNGHAQTEAQIQLRSQDYHDLRELHEPQDSMFKRVKLSVDGANSSIRPTTAGSGRGLGFRNLNTPIANNYLKTDYTQAEAAENELTGISQNITGPSGKIASNARPATGKPERLQNLLDSKININGNNNRATANGTQ